MTQDEQQQLIKQLKDSLTPEQRARYAEIQVRQQLQQPVASKKMKNDVFEVISNLTVISFVVLFGAAALRPFFPSASYGQMFGALFMLVLLKNL